MMKLYKQIMILLFIIIPLKSVSEDIIAGEYCIVKFYYDWAGRGVPHRCYTALKPGTSLEIDVTDIDTFVSSLYAGNPIIPDSWGVLNPLDLSYFGDEFLQSRLEMNVNTLANEEISAQRYRQKIMLRDSTAVYMSSITVCGYFVHTIAGPEWRDKRSSMSLISNSEGMAILYPIALAYSRRNDFDIPIALK